MRFAAMKKLLTNNGRFKPNDPDYRRVYLLNAFLMLFIGLSVFFGIFNAAYLSIGAYLWAAAGVLGVLTFLYFHRTDRIGACSLIVVAVVLCMLVVMFLIAGNQSYMMAWVCVFPPLALFLLGQKRGLIVSLLMLIFLAVFIALRQQSWSPAVFTIKSVVNILGSAFSLILLIGYFELSRNEAASAVRRKQDELVSANNALSASREELRLILDSTAEAIFGVDMETRCTFCNTNCLEILGLGSEDDLLGRDIHELIHNRHRDGSPLPRSECNIVRTCMEGAPVHAEDEVFWRPGGASFDVEYNSYPQYKDGEIVGAVVTFTDNSLKKLHEQQIEYFSSHDSLTGLLNRSRFEAMLRRADIKNGLPMSIIMGDLNGLKLMNDIFGHSAGDELLVKAAEILRRACRADDLIARIGGDEFVVLLPRTHRRDAELVMDRIKSGMTGEQVNTIMCSISLGCDTKTNSEITLGTVLQNAENEMYREKSMMRSQVNDDMINAIIMMLYQKDPREEPHSANVSELCKAIGEALGLSTTEIAQLRSAGFLHDIGKIGIDSKLLDKEAPYSEEEDQGYKQHPVIGFRILNLFDNTLGLAESVYSHHERWDGTGFPRALKGTEIPLMARIIAVAGWYDYILYRQSVRPPTHGEAMARLREEAGLRLDPQIVDIFVQMMEKENARREG
jgi:diguanylate cyclase (GGDEF)-like protein/PAS domain S-box-containing protein